MRYSISLIISIFLWVSCTDSKIANSKIADANRELIGTWELTSVSTPSDQISKPKSEISIFKFWNDSTYSYVRLNECATTKQSGSYLIVDNPNRKFLTLCFVPDLDISAKDTLREEYMNFDILKLDSNVLELIDYSVLLEGSGHKIFNQISKFKKVR